MVVVGCSDVALGVSVGINVAVLILCLIGSLGNGGR